MLSRVKQPKIVTVTLNPALDHTVYVERFQTGQVNRVQEQRIDPGGKGINVAKVVRSLGYLVCVTGFLGQENSKIFYDYFGKNSIENAFVEVAGAARANIKIVDNQTGMVSEINFPGLECTGSDLEKLTTVILRLASDHQWFVFSGSLPQGVSDDVYGQLITLLRQQGANVILDTSGAALSAGIKAKPYAIKPNLEELGQLLGRTVETEEEIVKAVKDLLDGGIKKVLVTLGARGAIVADDSGMLSVRPPAVAAKSTVGAGDAMVAGFVVGQARGLSLEECARLGTAAASASVAQPGTQAGPIKQVEQLLTRVNVTRIDQYRPLAR